MVADVWACAEDEDDRRRHDLSLSMGLLQMVRGEGRCSTFAASKKRLLVIYLGFVIKRFGAEADAGPGFVIRGL